MARAMTTSPKRPPWLGIARRSSAAELRAVAHPSRTCTAGRLARTRAPPSRHARDRRREGAFAETCRALALDDDQASARRLVAPAWLPHPFKRQRRRADHCYPHAKATSPAPTGSGRGGAAACRRSR